MWDIMRVGCSQSSLLTWLFLSIKAAEASLEDPWVRHGDLLALQRRVLRLGKPPRRWKRPPWAARCGAARCD